jgi:hypothetical protein
MQGIRSRIYVLVVLLFVGITLSGSQIARAQQGTETPAAAPQAQPAPQGAAQPPAAAPAAQEPVGPDEVVMTIGDTKITAKEFEQITQSLPPEAAQALVSMGKKGFAERYANLVSLAKEGEKRKVDESPVFKQMVEFQRMMLLAQMTVNQILTAMPSISDEEVSYYYTSHQPDFQQVKLRGIYIPFSNQEAKPADPKAKPAPGKKQLTEAEAKAKAEEIRNRIKSGESMAAIAKKESDHPTAANGGDFGFVRHGQFAPQIDNVIFALEPKQISIPVKDRFGYFIFQVEEKRVQPLAEAKPTIENGLRQQKMGEALSKVQSGYEVTYNPRFFNEPSPGTPGAPPAQPAAPAPAAPAK